MVGQAFFSQLTTVFTTRTPRSLREMSAHFDCVCVGAAWRWPGCSAPLKSRRGACGDSSGSTMWLKPS